MLAERIYDVAAADQGNRMPVLPYLFLYLLPEKRSRYKYAKITVPKP